MLAGACYHRYKWRNPAGRRGLDFAIGKPAERFSPQQRGS